MLLKFGHVEKYRKGEAVFKVGQPSDACYLIYSGLVCLEICGISLFVYDKGQTFGEVGLLERRARRAEMRCIEDTTLLCLPRSSLEDDAFDLVLARDIYSFLGKRATRFLFGDDFYTNMRGGILIIQDGGCAPGYNTVTSFLTEKFENEGVKVYVAMEGFKSLISNDNSDYGCIVHDDNLLSLMSTIPRLHSAKALRDMRGAAFRTERYPQFKEAELQRRAAANIVARNVRCVVAIGGNGTFKGIKALSSFLPDELPAFFVPCTIDSDIAGTETIGQHTACELGAEKIRCYIADAYTHKRCYIKEMMGAAGGYHALPLPSVQVRTMQH